MVDFSLRSLSTVTKTAPSTHTQPSALRRFMRSLRNNAPDTTLPMGSNRQKMAAVGAPRT